MSDRRKHYVKRPQCSMGNFIKVTIFDILKFTLGCTTRGNKTKEMYYPNCWASRWFLLFYSPRSRSKVWILLFTIFAKTIIHLVYLPKFCTTIVLDFSLDDCNTPQKLETMVMQNLGWGRGGGGGGGGRKVHYGLCESSEYRKWSITKTQSGSKALLS